MGCGNLSGQWAIRKHPPHDHYLSGSVERSTYFIGPCVREVDFTGHVVIDTGAKDNAPMLHAGRALHSFPDCMLTVYRCGVPYTGAEAEAWCLLIHS